MLFVAVLVDGILFSLLLFAFRYFAFAGLAAFLLFCYSCVWLCGSVNKALTNYCTKTLLCEVHTRRLNDAFVAVTLADKSSLVARAECSSEAVE